MLSVIGPGCWLRQFGLPPCAGRRDHGCPSADPSRSPRRVPALLRISGPSGCSTIPAQTPRSPVAAGQKFAMIHPNSTRIRLTPWKSRKFFGARLTSGPSDRSVADGPELRRGRCHKTIGRASGSKAADRVAQSSSQCRRFEAVCAGCGSIESVIETRRGRVTGSSWRMHSGGWIRGGTVSLLRRCRERR